MYKWAVRRLVRHNVRALNRGDIGPTLAAYAGDATFVFPGSNSWAGRYRGRSAIESFLVRFVGAGLTGDVLEVLVNGPPWRTSVAVLLADRASAPEGNLVYENRAMLFCRVVWGKITYQEDFLDTQKVEAFDEYLVRSNSPAVPTARAGARPAAYGESDQPEDEDDHRDQP